MSDEVNDSIESEYVWLPSQGAFYKPPFKGLKQIHVRKLGWEDDDILTTKAFYENGSLFTELLKSTIIDANGFSYKELTNADKDAILWWLRINAFGSVYSIPHACPNCNKVHNIAWDLASFIMPTYPTDCVDEILEKGYRTITLPVSGLEVKLVPPSIGKETEVFRKLALKKEKTNSSKEFNVTGKLLTIIHSAKDTLGTEYTTPEQVNKWLLTANNGGKISIADSRYIQMKAKEIDLEVDTAKDFQCPHCDHIEEKVPMRMSIYFFYPEYLAQK